MTTSPSSTKPVTPQVEALPGMTPLGLPNCARSSVAADASRRRTALPHIKLPVSRGTCFPRRVTAAIGDVQAVGKNWSEACANLVQLVDNKLRHRQEAAIVFCADGTVLVGRTEAQGHTYAMTGRDRETSWTCGCGRGYNNMVDAMKRHADSCYGGAVAVRRV